MALTDSTQYFPAPEEEPRGGEAPASLVALDGPLARQQFEIRGAQITIGRGRSNFIRLVSKFISEVHCSISAVAHRYHIEDRHSKNGVLVNGRRLVRGRKTPLAHGDLITICDQSFLFRVHVRTDTITSVGELVDFDVRAATREAKELLDRFPDVLELRRHRAGT